MKEYNGLHNLRSVGSNYVFCPSCGNYLKVELNGWVHGEVFYCPSERKVYIVQLRDMTKRAGKGFLERCIENCALEDVIQGITKKNYKEVAKIIEEEK